MSYELLWVGKKYNYLEKYKLWNKVVFSILRNNDIELLQLVENENIVNEYSRDSDYFPKNSR